MGHVILVTAAISYFVMISLWYELDGLLFTPWTPYNYSDYQLNHSTPLPQFLQHTLGIVFKNPFFGLRISLYFFNVQDYALGLLANFRVVTYILLGILFIGFILECV